MSETCKNCGAWRGLHQSETMRCPLNGAEAIAGRKQIWDNSTYEEASDPSELNDKTVMQSEVIADLEAQTIAQARTIEQQAVIIREHQAADVIAVEAIRSQAAEIELLKEKVRYAYVQIEVLEKAHG